MFKVQCNCNTHHCGNEINVYGLLLEKMLFEILLKKSVLLKKPQTLFYTIPLSARVDLIHLLQVSLAILFQNHVSSKKDDFAKFLAE